jgi:FKBP-type peptidyl-prolyl cis-trans isomerase
LEDAESLLENALNFVHPMNYFSRFLSCGVVLLVAACAPKEEPPPPGPVVDTAAAEREKLFGVEGKAPDITWRTSGLGVRILVPGEGDAPKMADTVRVHYVGRLKDGTVFDDSHPRGKPSEFVVNQLIGGWSVAMSSLKPGGRGIFFIPPLLGYGSRAIGKIPANSGLIFEVELLAVNPEPAQNRE